MQDYRTETNPIEEGAQVADLSSLARKLLAGEDISDDLDELTENRLVDYARSMLNMSYDKVSKRYDAWAEADKAHDLYVTPDETEFRNKVVIPDTRAVADTVLTYLMAAITGRNPMFQLEGQNRKSRRASLVLERVLHRHTRSTQGEARLAQMFLDGIRYGVAPTKVVWDNKLNANAMVNFDPRRTFPDPRTNTSNTDEMAFIGVTDFLSTNALIHSGLYPKLSKYPKLQTSTLSQNGGWRAHQFNKDETNGYNIDPQTQNDSEGSNFFTLGRARILDEVWVRFEGWQLNLPQIKQLYIVMAILDEGVVVRFQLNPYGQQYPFVMSGLYQDAHKTFGQSLYDLLQPVHDLSTYLLRTRMDNISASLNNLIFADPTRVVIPDLIDRNPWGVVRMTNGAQPGEGVHVASIPDVTRGHLQDISYLSEMKQRVSAASDAQQGMPTSDVRSATEINRLSQLGSQRLGVLARLISTTAIRPAVRMQVANIQDFLLDSGSIKISANELPSELAPLTSEGYLDFDPRDLQGDIDYLVVDGTLPVEPTRDPNTWMAIMQTMTQTGLSQEYKMNQIAEEAIRAMGVSDLDRFRISAQERQQNGPTPSQQLQIMQAQQGNTVQTQSAENVSRELEKGNLIPMNRGAQ